MTNPVYLGIVLYALTGALIAFSQRRAIDRHLKKKGLSPQNRTVYMWVALIWPLVLLGELHGRLSKVGE
jgi:hypothetical protein